MLSSFFKICLWNSWKNAHSPYQCRIHSKRRYKCYFLPCAVLMSLKFSIKSAWSQSIEMKRVKAPGLSQSKKSPFLQSCFGCFITVTRKVIWEWSCSYNPSLGTQKPGNSVVQQSHGIKNALPALLWQQFPGSEEQGFSAGASAPASRIQNWVSSTSCYDLAQPKAALRPVEMRVLPLCPWVSGSFTQGSPLTPLILSCTSVKPSQLCWALGPVVSQEFWGRCKGFAFSIWKLCHSSAGYLGSYFKMAVCMLCTSTDPFHHVNWIGSLWSCSMDSIELWELYCGPLLLGVWDFSYNFLKLLKLYFRAIWVKLSGLISFFLTSLVCIKSPNNPNNAPKVKFIGNPFSPSAYISLFISCLQNYQIFLLLVVPQPWGSAVSRKGCQTPGRNESNGKGSQMLGIDE